MCGVWVMDGDGQVATTRRVQLNMTDLPTSGPTTLSLLLVATTLYLSVSIVVTGFGRKGVTKILELEVKPLKDRMTHY